ncbi:MAG TPA: Uma2 family endonuclease [Planctomycetaceae bacterium]|jgi:Uma2 family endonuclease|nr:Uma2 family endonuclease [Planctomycetaceae bacterium]
MSIAQRAITAAEFERMTFDRPTELVCGELVEQTMPTIQHGRVCALITAFLTMWARQAQSGVVFSHDSFVLTDREPDSVRGPDCAYIRWEKLPGGKMPVGGTLTIPADLVIEVISPSDRWTNVLDKVLEYLRSGVTEVWVIDPEQRSVTAHRSDAASIHFDGDDELTRPDLLPGFSCRVSELFADLATT